MELLSFLTFWGEGKYVAKVDLSTILPANTSYLGVVFVVFRLQKIDFYCFVLIILQCVLNISVMQS